jgi:hypothetical protein
VFLSTPHGLSCEELLTNNCAFFLKQYGKVSNAAIDELKGENSPLFIIAKRFQQIDIRVEILSVYEKIATKRRKGLSLQKGIIVSKHPLQSLQMLMDLADRGSKAGQSRCAIRDMRWPKRRSFVNVQIPNSFRCAIMAPRQISKCYFAGRREISIVYVHLCLIVSSADFSAQSMKETHQHQP